MSQNLSFHIYHFYRVSPQALMDPQNGPDHWVCVDLMTRFRNQNQNQLAQICVNDPDDDLFKNLLMIRQGIATRNGKTGKTTGY